MTASLRDADPLTPFPDHALSEVVAQHKAAPKDPTTLVVPHRESDLAQNLRGTGRLQNTARGNPVNGRRRSSSSVLLVRAFLLY